eukprot:1379975-Rhodomonas_salina.1
MRGSVREASPAAWPFSRPLLPPLCPSPRAKTPGQCRRGGGGGGDGGARARARVRARGMAGGGLI